MTNTLAVPLAESLVSDRIGEREPGAGELDDADWGSFYDLFDPEFDDPPPPPSWALRASAERDRSQLTHAATRPVDVESLTALARVDPSTADADALLDAIAAAQRLINHTQALQQRYLAALARPGVATPLASLVDAALHPTGRRDDPALGVAGELPDDLPVTEAGDVDYAPLLDRPAWREALTDQACRFASAEVSCLLRLTPITARLRIENALVMVRELPATLAAQQRGDLDGYRASIIAERTSVLSPELRCEVERRIVPFATGHTSGALRRTVDRAVIAADATAAEHRATYAKARRGVTVDAAEDGMATLRLFDSAANTALVNGVLDTIATSVRSAGLADGRGASQLRADAMVDLFRTLNQTGHARIGIASDIALDGSGVPGSNGASGSGGASGLGGACGRLDADNGIGSATGMPRATGVLPVSATALHGAGTTCAASPNLATLCAAGILPVSATATSGTRDTVRHGVTLNVYIDAATLANANDDPGELAGIGAITADTARALARSADSIRAILTRPAGPDRACGTVLDAGRTVYRPPTAVADYVTARDRTCQFPGCRAPASRCDIDHRDAFDDGGDTCPHNLDLLCRAHHRLKTFTRWRAEPAPSGLLTWTSPLGRCYSTESAHLLPGSTTALGGPPSDRAVADDPPPF